MQHVDVKVHANVATIMLDRPDVHHSLSPGLLSDLQLALSDVHQEKRVRAVVLTAGGDHFCSGIDLAVLREIGELPDSEPPEMNRFAQCHQFWRQWADTIEQLLRFPKPIVAAVDGAAVGGGLALVLACDLVVATDRATFAAPAAKLGLVGGVTTALLAFRLGSARAARFSLTGEPIRSDEAAQCGLVSQVVPPDQIWVAASDWAHRCCRGPAEAIQATKRVLNETVGEALLHQIAAASADSATACSTEAAREGVNAFLEKRDPVWP